MAINEQAPRDATSKAPVLIYSVNQGGWPPPSPPPPPLRPLGQAGTRTNTIPYDTEASAAG